MVIEHEIYKMRSVVQAVIDREWHLLALMLMRALPHFESYDRRLDACAERLIFRSCETDLPPITFGQIFGWQPVPDWREGYPSGLGDRA